MEPFSFNPRYARHEHYSINFKEILNIFQSHSITSKYLDTNLEIGEI